MPPRSLWAGTISFGLVNVPVRMYSAIEEHTLHFHLLHEKDDSRIGYEKICKAARGGRSRGRPGGGKSRDGLAELSKDELYERAKKADIPGRAKMSKDELVSALERAA